MCHRTVELSSITLARTVLRHLAIGTETYGSVVLPRISHFGTRGKALRLASYTTRDLSLLQSVKKVPLYPEPTVLTCRALVRNPFDPV